MRFQRPIVAAGLCLCVIALHARDLPLRDTKTTTSEAVQQLHGSQPPRQLRRPGFRKTVDEFGWVIAAASLAAVAAGSTVAEWVSARRNGPGLQSM